MRAKLIVAVAAGAFLFTCSTVTMAQTDKTVKENKKTVQTTVVKKDQKETPKAPKTNTKKSKAMEKCTDKEKANCAKECGNE